MIKHYKAFIFGVFFFFLSSNAYAACVNKKLVILGDSLVAGYGLAPGEAYPEQLGKVLGEKGIEIEIINAGVSGDTSSGGLARLDWSVGEADAVILELGANDALRGIPVEITKKNLENIIVRLKSQEKAIMLVGMMAPPNMGKIYGDGFNSIFPELVAKHDIAFYPFFLDGVAADPELNQADGIHPTKQGIAIMVERSLPVVTQWLNGVCK
ncbi:MAG: arylesterase [Pseudomonadota bacterium]